MSAGRIGASIFALSRLGTENRIPVFLKMR
jgi:hypothetical protein